MSRSPRRIHELAPPGPEGLGPSPEDWLRRLPGPVQLTVPGRDRRRSRAWVTLLHGNEPSGLRALHAWLSSSPRPCVDLHAFVLSVETARHEVVYRHRMRPGARDLNRCFEGPADDAPGALAAELLERLRRLRPEVLVDIHNTSGLGPAYAVSTRVDADRLALASLFSSYLIHTDIRLASLMEAVEDELPVVTVECGGAGDPDADAVALRGLERLASEPSLRVPEPPPRVLSHPVRVQLRPGVSVAYARQPVPGVELTLRSDLDRHNFEPVLPGQCLGWLGRRGLAALDSRAGDDVDRTHELFHARGELLEPSQPLDLLMVTTTPRIAREDCLFYAVPDRGPAAR